MQLVKFLCKLVVISILQKGKNMKKLIWGLVIVAVVAVFGGRAWYLHKQSTTEKDVVKIGAILPLSGVMSHNGEMALNAMKMLEDKVNATQSVKVKVVAEDGKFTTKDSLSAFRKLQSAGIDLILAYGDVPSKAIVYIAKEQNIPLFTVSDGKDLNAVPVVVNLIPKNEYMMDYMTKFVVEDVKPESVAVIHQKDLAAIEKGDLMVKNLKDAGITVTKQEQFAFDAPEVRSIVSKALYGDPKAVVLFGWGPAYTAILNTLREQGFKGPIITDWNISAVFDSLAKTAYPLYWMDTYFDEHSTLPEVQKFVAEYKQRYNMVPDIFAMLSYIGTQTITSSLKTNNYQPMTVMQDVIKTHDLPTVLGKVSIGDDRYLELPLVIKQMQPDGTAKIVKE